MRGADVGGAGLLVPERLDQDILGRVVQAAGPVEPKAARLRSGRLREIFGDLGPAVGIARSDLELGGNENDEVLPCKS
jgi:hypothetical protein